MRRHSLPLDSAKISSLPAFIIKNLYNIRLSKGLGRFRRRFDHHTTRARVGRCQIYTSSSPAYFAKISIYNIRLSNILQAQTFDVLSLPFSQNGSKGIAFIIACTFTCFSAL